MHINTKSNIKFGLGIALLWFIVIGIMFAATLPNAPQVFKKLGFAVKTVPNEHRVIPEPISTSVVMENCRAVTVVPESTKFTVTCYQKKEINENPQ